MTTGKQLAALLLLTTALTGPGLAYAHGAVGEANQEGAPPPVSPDEGAQDDQAAPEDSAEPGPDSAEGADADNDVSVPGGVIIVTGRINRDPTRGSTQVLSVLSTEQIARTGEGNIAGALGRVTGLSVVGSGYVYVRGLGDRYSLALLNGSPLPSPEPLKRVVPLDLFPTGVIASSLVQKSYSVNYPGEFGGGVINLTTRAIPRDSYLNIEVGSSWDTETTNRLGYTYYGSPTDWTGYDSGWRDNHPALDAYFANGLLLGADPVNAQAIARELVTGRNAVVQRWQHIPPNFSASFSGGHSFDLGGSELGVIFGGNYRNRYVSRDAIQQTSLASDISTLASDFRRVTTDQRIVASGLLGFGLQFGDNTVRWTNVYIHDTIKHTRFGIGQKDEQPPDYLQQETAWYERQLFDTQLVAELEPMDGLDVDLRGGYANSKRDAPGELSFEYVRTNSAADLYGAYFVNRLNRSSGFAQIVFSKLDEDLWSGGADVSYEIMPTVHVTVGGAYTDTERTSSRRALLFDPPSTFPPGIGLFRPDLLLQPTNIEFFGIGLIEADPGAPAFDAELETIAGYAKGNVEITPEVSIEAGVRYETADQTVTPIDVFVSAPVLNAGTALSNDYWLPAATLTWQIQPDLQFRLSGSKTIARPQFRELIYQPFFDPDSNRTYVGNPLLIDSELTNAEARLEYYFAADQRVSVSGFYKKIDRPIETFVYALAGGPVTSFANAPSAQLYGGEFEVQKYFDHDDLSFLPENRRVVIVGNYTYTKSQLEVAAGDTTNVFGVFDTRATSYFRDGAPMTGQSDHLVNVQVGLENPDRLSQQTILLSYASERVVSRGLTGIPPQPDIIEEPGFNLDFVAREGFTLFGQDFEGKLEVRNILGTRHHEFQETSANHIEVNTYDVGTTFALSLSVQL